MKKHFYHSLLATVCFSLFLCGCSKSDPVTPQAPDTGVSAKAEGFNWEVSGPAAARIGSAVGFRITYNGNDVSPEPGARYEWAMDGEGCHIEPHYAGVSATVYFGQVPGRYTVRARITRVLNGETITTPWYRGPIHITSD